MSHIDAGSLPRIVRAAELPQLDLTVTAVRARCRSGRWRRLAPGIYLTSPQSTVFDRMIAAAMHGGPDCALSASAALDVWGLGKHGDRDTVLVLVPADYPKSDSDGIRLRRTTRLPHALIRGGLPLVPVARAVADQALTLRTLHDTRALVAAAVQQGLVRVDDLVVEYDEGPRRGSKWFGIALEDMGMGARSAPEAEAARLLRSNGITDFELNAEIFIDGRRYVVDILFRKLRAVLEIDSKQFHFSAGDWERTLERDQDLEGGGYSVVHVIPRQLRDPVAFVSRVRRWRAGLEARAAA